MATNQQPTDVNSALADIIGRSDWRQALVNDYAETATRLQQAYARILPDLQAHSGALVDRISKWVTDNPDASLTQEYVRGFKEYQDLLARVEVEMQDFAALLKNEAGIVEARAMDAGAQSALELAQAVSGGAGEVVAAAWNRVDPVALQQVIGYVDSPAFRANTASFGENAATNIGDVILSGIAQGKSPGSISNILQNWMAIPAAWADTTVRTIQLYSYRGASVQSYRENPDVVSSWMWWASLDDRTCGVCVSEHGQIHPLDEELNSHHNCRCTPIPVITGTSWAQDVTTGRDWLEDQPESVQRSILGAGKFDLYQSGNLDWDRFVVERENDVFGMMKNEATLAELDG